MAGRMFNRDWTSFSSRCNYDIHLLSWLCNECCSKIYMKKGRKQIDIHSQLKQGDGN